MTAHQPPLLPDHACLIVHGKDQPGIVVTAGEQDDPVRGYTKGAAVAMPVLYSNKAHVCAQVLAA